MPGAGIATRFEVSSDARHIGCPLVSKGWPGVALTPLQVRPAWNSSSAVNPLRFTAGTPLIVVEVGFEGVPQARGQDHAQTDAPSPQYVSDYLATPDGLQLTKAFMQIPDPKLRRSIVKLVDQIAGPDDQ